MGGGRHGFLCLSKNKVPGSPRDLMTDWHDLLFFIFFKNIVTFWELPVGKKEANIFEMSAEVQTTAQRSSSGLFGGGEE